MKKLNAVGMMMAGLAGSVSLGLVGCDTVKAPPAGRADTVPQQNYPQVVVESALQPYVGINKPVVTDTDGILKVSTPVRLLSNPGQFSRVQYRYTFLDGNGAPLRTQTEWRFAQLEPRIQQFFTGNALDNNAADFRLEIRSAR
jgi:uncharacterized protein YcfL